MMSPPSQAKPTWASERERDRSYTGADVFSRWDHFKQLRSILLHCPYKDKWETDARDAAVTLWEGASLSPVPHTLSVSESVHDAAKHQAEQTAQMSQKELGEGGGGLLEGTWGVRAPGFSAESIFHPSTSFQSVLILHSSFLLESLPVIGVWRSGGRVTSEGGAATLERTSAVSRSGNTGGTSSHPWFPS